MSKGIRARLGGSAEQGFTVVELLTVLIVIGILLAIAVPSYMGFRDRTANNAAKENLRAAQSSARAYYEDKGTYVGMTTASLAAIDSGISHTLKVTDASEDAYTMCDDPSGKAWQVVGPEPGSSSYTSVSSC
jgi:type IV pilus assembly protein PilA